QASPRQDAARPLEAVTVRRPLRWSAVAGAGDGRQRPGDQPGLEVGHRRAVPVRAVRGALGVAHAGTDRAGHRAGHGAGTHAALNQPAAAVGGLAVRVAVPIGAAHPATAVLVRTRAALSPASGGRAGAQLRPRPGVLRPEPRHRLRHRRQRRVQDRRHALRRRPRPAGLIAAMTKKGNGLVKPLNEALNTVIKNGNYKEVLDRCTWSTPRATAATTNSPGIPRPSSHRPTARS